MKYSECIMKVSDLITSQVDLSKAKLSNEFYYSSVVFCVIDAVFSINSNYASTKNVVDRIAKRIDVNQFRLYGSSINRTEDTVGVSRYLYLTSNIDFTELANNYYGNRQRTSSKNGILKAQAVHEFLMVLERFEVDDFSDLKKIKGNEDFENEIKSIKGQGSGLSLKYFYMLSGDESYIKVDRHLTNYISEVLGKQLSMNDTEDILLEVAEYLKKSYTTLTPRHLDHEIWKLMSQRKNT